MNAFSFTERFGARIIAAIALFSLVASLVPMQLFAAPPVGAGGPPEDKKVNICKANQSLGSFVEGVKNVSENAVQTGLANSGVNGDIVENGQNWNFVYPNGFTGQQIFESGCANLVDQCPNIAGGQATIPNDLVKDQAGNCVTPTGTLTINKVISGITGILTSSFSYILNGGAATSFSTSNTATLNVASNYTVTESGVVDNKVTVDGKSYNVSYDNCDSTMVLAGKTCTITNAYIPTCSDGILNQDEGPAADQGGICAIVVNGCTDPNAANYVQNATAGNPDADNCEYEIASCEVTTSLLTTNLSTWDLTQTRATGHNELVEDGLRIYTEGNTSTDKAAGYYTTNFPLRELGTQTVDEALDYDADFGIEPGLQLVIDFDNNGTVDGILVGEAVYETTLSNSWWLTNSAAQFVKDAAPNTGGGHGTNWFGTPTGWLNAFPDAQVKAIGYSIGSGVYGDGVINSINLGCVEYTFDLPPLEPICEDKNAQNFGEREACEFYTSVCPAEPANLLTNGSFEDDEVTNPSDWQIFPAVTGWMIGLSDGLELWANGFLGGASDGNQNAELDGNDATMLTQTVATIPGATYELSFDFRARTANSADNHIDAAVDGVSKVNVSTANTNWVTYGTTFVADASTDISFADLGIAQASGGTGTLLDDAVLCLVKEPDFCPNIDGDQTPQSGYTRDVNGQCYTPITACSVNVVSDTTNTHNDSAAIAITPNPAWVQTIASSTAKWIWGVPSSTPIDPVNSEVQTFKKTFVWSGTASAAILKISSDNGYSVKLNGTVVGSDAGEFNYQTVDTIVDLTDNVIVGINTLEISVTNLANGQTSLNTNPGGLLYDLTITNTVGECAPGGGGGDGGNGDEDDLYLIYGYVWHDDNRNEDWDGRGEEENEEESNNDEENPLAGWTITIDNGQGDVRTTTTDANGRYEFDVPAGTWTITEEVEGGWLRTTQESWVVVVPENLPAPLTILDSVMSLIIPTAHAQALPDPIIYADEYGEYNFGNDRRGGGGGGGNSIGDDDDDDDRPDTDVLGATDDREPMVLGEQVSAVPLGAADTGAGSTAPVAVDLFRLAPVAFIRRK